MWNRYVIVSASLEGDRKLAFKNKNHIGWFPSWVHVRVWTFVSSLGNEHSHILQDLSFVCPGVFMDFLQPFNVYFWTFPKNPKRAWNYGISHVVAIVPTNLCPSSLSHLKVMASYRWMHQQAEHMILLMFSMLTHQSATVILAWLCPFHVGPRTWQSWIATQPRVCFDSSELHSVQLWAIQRRQWQRPDANVGAHQRNWQEHKS